MHPIREPHQSGMLAVSERHRIYWEESGNPAGIPVIYLHGGPGAGTAPACRGFFNPEKYRIVLIDQRGSGRSEPYADIEENTTWDLVAASKKSAPCSASTNGWFSAARGAAPWLWPMPKAIPKPCSA